MSNIKLESLTRGRTDHFSNILTYREFSAGCYLFRVFNSALLFSQNAILVFPSSLPLLHDPNNS